MRPKAWTPTEEARLINLIKDGRMLPDIAQKLGKTYNSVNRKIQGMRADGHEIVTAEARLRREKQAARNAALAASRKAAGVVIPCLCCRNLFRSPDKKRVRLCGACKKGSGMSIFDAPGGNGCRNVVMGG